MGRTFSAGAVSSVSVPPDLHRSSGDQKKKPKFRLSRIWSLKGRSKTPE